MNLNQTCFDIKTEDFKKDKFSIEICSSWVVHRSFAIVGFSSNHQTINEVKRYRIQLLPTLTLQFINLMQRILLITGGVGKWLHLYSVSVKMIIGLLRIFINMNEVDLRRMFLKNNSFKIHLLHIIVQRQISEELF